ncbi:glyoxalase [Chryseotalea sanaruensis]|uniref:Glyoxalase n=1 Tax=Chryseotalea sanaruensis TaxID=2482724 RepID=A0A401U808_9BACT|nr:VOC family protein [Chryseotalea sanaruensis]GCC51016.1 glyoxalase [Chryseotalea sanaruensis]
MKIKQIKETCIYTQDLETARLFYCEKLRLPLISYLPDKHLFVRVGNSVLLCFNPQDSQQKKTPPGHYAQGKIHFAFEVDADDYQKTKQEIIEMGITISDEVTWENGQQSFYFEDPSGNVLEVVPVGIWIA